jgi:hypothetical protein
VRILYACVAICFLSCPAWSQLNITLELERSNYLLFEPVNAKVTVYNNTGFDVALTSEPGRSWLSFYMTRRDGRPVLPDHPGEFPTDKLKAGEARAWVINLTPLMSFRDLGEYKVRAVLDLPGQGQIMSSQSQFGLNKGQTVWTQARAVEGSERNYALVRFASSPSSTQLYGRVEDVKENVVYATVPLGEVVAMTDPEAYFDKEGRWHVLHVVGTFSYRYSRLKPDGAVEFQDNYSASGNDSPKLVQLKDGSVLIQGGRAESETKPRAKLSDTQTMLKSTKPAPLLTPTPKP